MADYGVNIAVAVKNTQAITKLSRDTDLLGQKIRNVNDALEQFGDLNGKTVVNSVANFNKELAKAAENFNDVRLGSDRAADAARNFAQAQDLANEALREQAALLAEVRNQGRSGTLRGGTQYSSPAGPGFSGLVSRQASETALSSPLPPSVPVALRSPMRPQSLLPPLRSPMRPQSLLPQMEMTAQAGKIASDMEDVYASILRLTEKANQEEAEKLQTLRQGTREVEELAQKYRAVNETQKTGKQLQLEIRRNILETKQAAAKEAKAANEELLERLRNLEAIGAERREQFVKFNKEEEEKRRIRQRELDFERRLSTVQERRAQRAQKLRSATSSALIGGAFPLLFGQGLGASAGGLAGGFGGGMIGGEFGFGVSLIGTQLGAMFDQLVAKATGLASSLETTGSILSGLEEAGFKVSDSTKRVIASYEEAGLLADAYSLAIDEVNRVLGPDGADKLHAYKIETEKLQSEFEKASAALQSELIPALTGFLRIILGVKSAIDGFAGTPLGKAIFNAGALKQAAFAIPGLGPAVVGGGALINKLQEIGAPTGPAEKSEAQIAAEQSALEGQLVTREALNKAAREQGYLVDAQIAVAKLGNNLLDEQVVAAKKRLIDETRNAAVRKEGVTFQQVILAGKERELALTNLQRSVDDAQLAQQEKEIRNANRLEKKNDRIAKKKQRDAERLAKAADRELERADNAFNSASNQLDKIIQRQEDKMAFEREYAELIRSGSTPAAARQAIQLQQELLDLNRRHKQLEDELKVRIEIAKTAVLTAEASPEAVPARINALKKELKELEGALAGLPGKKEDAEGAIAAALAPKSDRQRLLEYMDDLQGKINDMMDPVRQLTALSETLGSAFSESFKGLITGSMSAREALANLFQRTADHFLDMAAQMIAAQIKMKILGIGLDFLGNGLGGGAASVPSSAYGDFSIAGPSFFSGGMISGFANGGRPPVGRPSIVGERGPELFVPRTAGTIIPNHAMGGANVTVNVDASGSSVEGNADQASQLGKAIGIAVQQELVKQKRPGGLLAR